MFCFHELQSLSQGFVDVSVVRVAYGIVDCPVLLLDSLGVILAVQKSPGDDPRLCTKSDDAHPVSDPWLGRSTQLVNEQIHRLNSLARCVGMIPHSLGLIHQYKHVQAGHGSLSGRGVVRVSIYG